MVCRVGDGDGVIEWGIVNSMVTQLSLHPGSGSCQGMRDLEMFFEEFGILGSWDRSPIIEVHGGLLFWFSSQNLSMLLGQLILTKTH